MPAAIGTQPVLRRSRFLPPALALIALSAVAVFVFKNFLLGKYVFLYKDVGSDSINIAYPGLVHYADYLRSWGIPGWSFSQGMGQWIFPFSFGDPFNIILYYLGSQNIAFGIACVEIFKILCAGMLFFAFLRTALAPAPAAIVGAILYAFSGFSIVGSCWNVFTTEAVLFALLLLSVELVLRKGSWILFPLWVALTGMLQPFYLFIYGLFLMFYLFLRLSLLPAMPARQWARIPVKILLLTLLGTAMASVIIIPEIAQMLGSPRAGDASYMKALASTQIFCLADPQQLVTLFFRLFSSDMIGTGSGFSGWNNYLEAPAMYCGLISLIVAPQMFAFANKRRFLLYALFASFLILPLAFPYFRYALWMFSGNYYRALSLMESTCVLVLGCQALSSILRHGRCNIPLLAISAAILLLILYYPYPSGLVCINKDLRNLAVLLILVYASSLAIFSLGKLRSAFPFLLILITVFEACCFSFITVNDRRLLSVEELRARIGYNDYTVEAVRRLKQIDKGFFRVDKTYYSGLAMHGSLNDAKVQNYYGTSSYSSFNQPSYIKFLDGMGIISGANEVQTRWVQGLLSHPILQGFASVKYILTKDTGWNRETWCYRPLGRFGDVYVVRNKLAVPFGFTYDSIFPLSQFRKLPPSPAKDLTLLHAAVMDDSAMASMKWLKRLPVPPPTQKPFSVKLLADDIASIKRDTFDIGYFSQNRIAGSISLDEKKLLFFSIPFDRGWHAKIDGRPVRLERVSIGFTGLGVDKGRHCVDLYFRSTLLPKCAVISVLGISLYLALLFARTVLARQRRRKVID